MSNYKEPKFKEQTYRCFYCGDICQHEWVNLMFSLEDGNTEIELWLARCVVCRRVSFWSKKHRTALEENMTDSECGLLYPHGQSYPPAREELDDEIKGIYEEAGSVLDKSPRAAAALLRLALEKLLKKVGYKGRTLFDMIGKVANDGIDENTKRAMDVIRYYVGKDIHTGEINLNDKKETVELLFEIINKIVYDKIILIKKVDSAYNAMPENARSHIEMRDGRSNTEK